MYHPTIADNKKNSENLNDLKDSWHINEGAIKFRNGSALKYLYLLAQAIRSSSLMTQFCASF